MRSFDPVDDGVQWKTGVHNQEYFQYLASFLFDLNRFFYIPLLLKKLSNYSLVLNLHLRFTDSVRQPLTSIQSKMKNVVSWIGTMNRTVSLRNSYSSKTGTVNPLYTERSFPGPDGIEITAHSSQIYFRHFLGSANNNR